MQTEVIAAIVGGLIAIGGAVVAYLYRVRHEASVVNTAVLAEISRLLFVIRRHETWWRGCVQSGNTDYPLIPFATDVYREQIKKIGTIDRSVIVPVVRFYGYIGYLNALQAMKAQYRSGPEFDEQYLLSMRTLLADYEGAFDTAFAKYGVSSGTGSGR